MKIVNKEDIKITNRPIKIDKTHYNKKYRRDITLNSLSDKIRKQIKRDISTKHPWMYEK